MSDQRPRCETCRFWERARPTPLFGWLSIGSESSSGIGYCYWAFERYPRLGSFPQCAQGEDQEDDE